MILNKITNKYIDSVWEKQTEYLGEQKNVNKIQPLVSVLVTTYQQEKYIAQCLDGLLKQKTNFDFEIIIGEDESTDNTREICKQYAEEHQDKIRLYLRDRKDSAIYDESGKFIKSINYFLTHKSSKGKYIAICEGDDYWTDPLKLQKQVDFLEKNEDYSICFHNVEVLEGDKIIGEIENYDKQDYTIEDLLQGNFIANVSVMRRNIIKELPGWVYECKAGDYALHILYSTCGKIHYVNENMAVYRQGVGVWSSLSNKEILELDIKLFSTIIQNLENPKWIEIMSLSLHNKIIKYYNSFIPNFRHNINKSKIRDIANTSLKSFIRLKYQKLTKRLK